MTENRQSSPKGNAGLMALVTAAVAVWLIYSMATATETPRQALALLQYGLLACAVIGCIGSTVKYLSDR